MRSRLYAAKAVREEHSADDGSIELDVELPDVELMSLPARQECRSWRYPGCRCRKPRFLAPTPVKSAAGDF